MIFLSEKKKAPRSRHFCNLPGFAFPLSHRLSQFTRVLPALCFLALPNDAEISARSNVRRSPRFFTSTISMHPHCSVSRILVQHPSLLDTSSSLLVASVPALIDDPQGAIRGSLQLPNVTAALQLPESSFTTTLVECSTCPEKADRHHRLPNIPIVPVHTLLALV